MKKLIVAIAAAAISFAGFADASEGTWFTADFTGVTSDTGAWNDPLPEGAEFAEGALTLEDVESATPVVFTANEERDSEGGKVIFNTEVSFMGFDELPSIDDSAKAGVCALVDGNYYAVAYDNEGLTNKWVDTGIAADLENPVAVSVTVTKDSSAAYKFGDSAPFGTTINGNVFQEVCYSGNGKVSALTGDFEKYAVPLILPTIEGLVPSCELEEAAPGAEVTVMFGKGTKIPSKDSAVYIVQEDGTLILKEGETEPEAQDPGAKIGTAVYLTFAEAYEAADGADPIELCADQELAFDLEKAITIDLAGKVLTVKEIKDGVGVAINGVAVEFIDSAEEEKGKLVLGAELSVADSNASLDIAAIDFECDGGYLTGVEGMIYVSEDMVSANKMLFEGYFGEAPEELSVIVQVGEELVYNGAGDRFAIAEEVAYATVGEEDAQYVESFASIQAAIDAANEVYLCFAISGIDYLEEDITFGAETVVYAEETYGADALANCTIEPETVAFDETLGDFGGWKISGEPPVPTTYVAKIGDREFETLEEAIDVVEDDQTITLLTDVQLKAPIKITKFVSLDIGEFDITPEAAFTRPAGSKETIDAMFVVRYGGEFNVSGTTGVIDSSAFETIYSPIKLTEYGETYDGETRAKLTVNANLTGYYYAITGNGGRPGTDITVNGGTLTAVATDTNLAIYNPQADSTVVINDGTLIGLDSAVEMRGGTLTVNSGTLTATATEYSVTPSGTASTTKGAAVAVAQHSTKGAIVATISGGTLTGVNAVSVANPQANDSDNVTVELGAAIYDGALAFAADGNATVVKTDDAAPSAPEGYKWVGNTLVKIQLATLTIETVENCSIVVSNDTAAVESGATFDKDLETKLTVYRTPAEGYELVDCEAVEEITMSGDVTVTAKVQEKQAEDWPDPADPEVIGKSAKEIFEDKVPDALADVPAGKFSAWAKKAGLDFADPGEIDVDAYLLDCAPAEVEAKKAEAVAQIKIASIQFVDDKWVVKTVGGKVEGESFNTNAKFQLLEVTDTIEMTAGQAWKMTLVPDTTPDNN